MKMSRILAVIAALLFIVSPALAQKGTPTLGVDRTGTDRSLCIYDPTPGAPCVPIGSFSTNTHTWSTAPNVTIPGATVTQPITIPTDATLPWCSVNGCTSTDVTGMHRVWTSTHGLSVFEVGTAFDGTLQTGQLTPWAATTSYAANVEVVHDSPANVYINVGGACTSGATGPLGAGSGQHDGSCIWNFENSLTFIGKINVGVFTLIKTNNGVTPSGGWGFYNSIAIQNMPSNVGAWVASEIAVNNSARDCVLAVDTCYGLLIDGFVTYQGSAAIAVTPLGTRAAWRDGIYMANKTASGNDIEINDAASIGISFNSFSDTANIHSQAVITDRSAAGTGMGIQLYGTYSTWAIDAHGSFKVGNATGFTGTPTVISMDTTCTNSAAANTKIRVSDNGSGSVFGFGCAFGEMEYVVPSGNVHDFYVGSTSVASIGAASAIFTVPVRNPTYAISGLPSCVAGLSGAHATVSNGVASPTYLSAVSTTGTSVDPVMCNGLVWIYG